MASRYYLIAIAWQAGEHKITSEIEAHVDTNLMRQDGLLQDVSYDAGYLDEVATIQFGNFGKYILPDDNPFHQRAKDWYKSLPHSTFLVMVHKAEWESGLSDD